MSLLYDHNQSLLGYTNTCIKPHIDINLHRFTNNNNNNNDKICSAHISTLLGAQGANPETPGQAPSLSRPVFFYVHYTTHGTYSFTSHPKDEAIVLLKDTSATTGQAGIRTHILATPELESNALDRSATTLQLVLFRLFQASTKLSNDPGLITVILGDVENVNLAI